MAKLSLEAAEAEYVRFCADNDIQLPQDEDGDKAKATIIRALESGRLVFPPDGDVVASYTLKSHPDSIDVVNFHEPTGATLSAMDRRKSGEDVQKLYSAMADMTELPAKAFNRMRYVDVKVCIAITSAFLS